MGAISMRNSSLSLAFTFDFIAAIPVKCHGGLFYVYSKLTSKNTGFSELVWH